MVWKKKGLLYSPAPLNPKLLSHAANPLAILLEKDIYRIFFSGRDNENRSSVGFVDIDIVTQTISYIHKQTVFEYGAKTSFYSHGASVGCSYKAEQKIYILFMGWQIPPEEHWRGDIGRLCISQDMYNLELSPTEPFISIDSIDPISLSYPWILQENNVYHMWYGSTITWDAGNKEMLHIINHAVSSDGETWRKTGTAVPYKLGEAQAFSRPTVIRDNEGYHMWFSYRSGVPGVTYRIGYAFSRDASVGELNLKHNTIDVSPSGWDSEMICYPFVFDHKGQRYMLYNGNGYGKTGFGLAIWE